MHRLALPITFLVLLPLLVFSLPQPTSTTKGATAKSKKKIAAKKRSAPVSAKVKAHANDAVAEWLDRDPIMENPAALIPFFEQLYRLKKGETQGNVHILHYGDSHTAADEWTGILRSLFQMKFGDGGNGFSHAGRPWNGYRRLDLKSYGSRGWYSDGLVGRQGDGMYGLSGVSLSARRASETIQLQTECDRAELYYLRQPGGGKLGIFDNGKTVEHISTDGEVAPDYFQFPVSPGEHLFEVRTMDRQPVRLFGWATEKRTGVTYETLGLNSAQASIILNWEDTLFVAHVAKRNPALIVLAYGTNEAGNKDLSVEGYRKLFTEVIEKVRHAAPAASILVVAPADRYFRGRRGWMIYENIDIIVTAQREAALAAGCAFWDMRERMGGKGSMRQWVYAGLAQYDHVHFTGQGYRMLGAALFKEMFGHYRTFAKVRDEPEKAVGAVDAANGKRPSAQ